MGIYKIGIKLMKSQRKDNIFYMITILVSTALIFNMINILNIKAVDLIILLKEQYYLCLF